MTNCLMRKYFLDKLLSVLLSFFSFCLVYPKHGDSHDRGYFIDQVFVIDFFVHPEFVVSDVKLKYL